MELFGILFSIPAAAIASGLYCLFLSRVVAKSEPASRWLRIASYVLLALFATEAVLLATLGAVRSRGLLGPAFYVAHLIFFFMGVPALANVLMLSTRGGVFAKWYVATVLCTIFAFCLVLLQYDISESLYGINGNDGPYSHGPRTALRDSH